MRSMETVAKERMEVAVCFDPNLFKYELSPDFRLSNNSPSGVKLATKMYPTLPTSSVSCSTKSASSRTSTSTVTINTA